MTAKITTYVRPPITEAVIELIFKSSLSKRDVDKVAKKFKDLYLNEEHIVRRDYELNAQSMQEAEPRPNIKNTLEGYKKSSDDMTELLIIWPQSFAVAQLAPYKDWETFYKRFLRDLKLWKSIVGFREIARVGVRYINRVDIPVTGPVIDHESYIQIYPKLPDSFPPMNAFGLQVQVPVAPIECNLRINSTAVPSPLINHTSFILDLDFFKDINLPQSDKSLQDLLKAIRDEKNKVFESLITNKARALFNGVI